MKDIKRVFSVLLCVSIIATLFAGCNKKKEANTIRILNNKTELAEKCEIIAKEYKKEKGIDVIVETVDKGKYEQELSSKFSTSEAPTIFQINGPVGYSNWKDYCADLTSTELYKHLIDSSLAISTKEGAFAIPYDIEGYGIIYNDKIMQKYFELEDRRTKYGSISQVNSFKALKEVVEDMEAHKEKLKIKGTFGVTSLKSGEDWRWNTHLLNIPIYYEFRENNTDLTSDNIKKISFDYSKNYKNIFDLYINNSTEEPDLLGSKTVSQSISEFAHEECAMVQNGNWAWNQISEVPGNKVKASDMRFLPIYTDMDGEENQGLCIGTQDYFCINSKASEEEQKLAEDFLYWLFSSEKGKDYVTNSLGFITPFDTFKNDEEPTDPLAKEAIRWMKTDEIETIPWNFTLFPSQKFKDDFGAELLQYAQGKKPWPDVQKFVVEEWQSEWKENK